MGVKSCDKNGCPEVMCRMLVYNAILNRKQHVCDDCYIKLRNSVARCRTEAEVELAIYNFFKFTDTTNTNAYDALAYFDTLVEQ